MKMISIFIAGLVLSATAFAAPEDGLMFHCTDEANREFTIEYLYDDPNIELNKELKLTGVEKTINWFHPYCSVGYTYKKQLSITLQNKFIFVSGGQTCEGEDSRHSCTIKPIYLNQVFPAAAACCSWGTEEKPIPDCMEGC